MFPRLWSRLSGTGSPALPCWPEGERHSGGLAWLGPGGGKCGGPGHGVATTRTLRCGNVEVLECSPTSEGELGPEVGRRKRSYLWFLLFQKGIPAGSGATSVLHNQARGKLEAAFCPELKMWDVWEETSVMKKKQAPLSPAPKPEFKETGDFIYIQCFIKDKYSQRRSNPTPKPTDSACVCVCVYE